MLQPEAPLGDLVRVRRRCVRGSRTVSVATKPTSAWPCAPRLTAKLGLNEESIHDDRADNDRGNDATA